MRNLSHHETSAIIWACGIAAVTIVGTAFMLRPENCTDEKAEVLVLKQRNLDLSISRSEVPYGTCINYETTRQQLCRNKSHIHNGSLYLRELKVDGEIQPMDDDT